MRPLGNLASVRRRADLTSHPKPAGYPRYFEQDPYATDSSRCRAQNPSPVPVLVERLGRQRQPPLPPLDDDTLKRKFTEAVPMLRAVTGDTIPDQRVLLPGVLELRETT